MLLKACNIAKQETSSPQPQKKIEIFKNNFQLKNQASSAD
jgi:hypothetical protein